MATNRKNASRASKNLLSQVALEPRKSNGRQEGQRNRESTTRPLIETETCPFHFVIFLGNDDFWYLSSFSHCSLTDRCHHYNHFPSFFPKVQKCDLNQQEMALINHSLSASVTAPAIRRLMKEHCNLNIDEQLIRKIRNDASNDIVGQISDELSANPTTAMGPARRLIQACQRMDDISFVYVTHNMRSGFVTFKKNRGESLTQSSDTCEENVGVTVESVELWRRELQIDTDEILVSFAFIHDEELRLTRMFPEFLAFDLTFGTNAQ